MDTRSRTSVKTVQSGSSSSYAGNLDFQLQNDTIVEQKQKEREARKHLVLWKKPLTTLKYFFLECILQAKNWVVRLRTKKRTIAAFSIFSVIFLFLYYFDGPHMTYFHKWQKTILWCGYWIGLGILSSVGLGTGLHTFLLYLGPHIAAVTLAAFECMSVSFPEPPYPDQIVCPDIAEESMTIWTIISKVRLEAFMWGFGTAIGELPPYFMARAARLTGVDPDDEDYEEALAQEDDENPDSLSSRAKLAVKNLIQRAGFLGIMLCASIPNPLFDLAGITCGHFLVPFSTFFGATVIGKAVIKMHIQKIFVVLTFSEHHVDALVDWMGYFPKFGPSLQAPFREFLRKQKANLHRPVGAHVETSQSWLQWVFEKLVVVMILYFVLSIINSTAQSFMARLQRLKREEKDKK